MSAIGVGRPARLRLFLEGIEVPVISAEVSSQPNAPAQCTLQMPPSDLGTKLLPRTLVHLFFLDYRETENPLLTYRGKDDQNPKPQNPSVYEAARERENVDRELSDQERETRNSRYKLLFAGEIMGYQWSKGPMQRSLVVQCLDLSNYWDYAYQFNNTDLFGPGQKALFSGGSTNLLTDFLSSPGEIIAGLLHLPSANYPALKGMLGGLIRMIEGIGGCYVQDDKFCGQNIFFSLAELRLHISQMITAYPEDNTVKRLLGASYDGLFGRTIGNLGDQVSIRTVLNALMGVIYHETTAVPSPYFSPGTNTNVTSRNLQPLSKLRKYEYIYQTAVLGQRMCEEIRRSLDPASLQEADWDAITLKERVRRNTVRLNRFAADTAQVRFRAAQDPSIKNQNKAILRLLDEIHTQMRLVSTHISKTQGGGKEAGPSKTKAMVALNKVRILLGKLERSEIETSDPETRTPDRLNSHIFKPDVWFAPPPRCNVIFPDQYDQMQMARSFMQEPTRLLLKLHDEFFGEDELFDHHIFAPRAQTHKGKKSTLQDLFARDVMQHELFTGIVPVFTKMGEMNVFALRTGEIKGKQPKIGLAQRSANYLYFKQRFSSRQMMIHGFFNPYLAPGFPGLVFDRYVNTEAVEAYRKQQVNRGKDPTEARKLYGTHFLGSFAAISHSISLGDMSTSVQMQYAREIDEGLEYFGPAIKDDQEVLKRLGTDALRTSYVAALTAPKVGTLGPAYGTIEEVTDVTASSEATDTRPAVTYPIYTGPRRKGDPSTDGQAKIGVPVRLGDVSAKLAADLGVNKIVTFRAYIVRESIPRYRREIVDLPAEEYIRPGWYDDCWHPANVGQVYQHYLRTGSITDKTQVGDPDGVPVADTPNQLARDELVRQATKRWRSARSNNLNGDARDGISPAVLTLDADASTQQAAEFLLELYSYCIESGTSVHRMIDAYTWRPIASLPDLFGTSDLKLDILGVKAEAGIEGLHSRAFGPFNDLFGLVTPEITEVLGVKKSDQARSLGDVRGHRHRAVLDYLDALVARIQKPPGVQ